MVYIQIYRVRGDVARGRGGGALIIFRRQMLLQQIKYRWKENLMDSKIHLKYRENISISRFYDRFL